MYLNILVHLMVSAVGILSIENIALTLNTTANGNVNLSTMEIVEDESNSLGISFSIEPTTTFGYDENGSADLFTKENEQNTDVTNEPRIENVTNLVIEQTTSVNMMESDAESKENISEEIDSRVSRNLESDMPMITENSILDLRKVVTEINVQEEINGDILVRKPTKDELKMLKDAEAVLSDNLALEDITNIIRVDPEMTNNENNHPDDVEDMESIFDERKFRHIKQKSNKNTKEFKIFFTETEGHIPTDPVEEESTKGIKINTNVIENSTEVIDDINNNSFKSEIVNEDEFYSIIDSIKKSLKHDKMEDFKISAVLTKNIPIPTSTQIPDDFVADSKFPTEKITTVKYSQAKSEKTAPYTTTEFSIDSATTEVMENEYKEALISKEIDLPTEITTIIASVEEQTELSLMQLDDMNQKAVYVNLPSINAADENKDKKISTNFKAEKELSSEEVEKFYNQAIDESYESFETEDDGQKNSENIDEERMDPEKFIEIIDVDDKSSVEDKNMENSQDITLSTKLLNNSASVAIRMGKEDEIIFIPSDAYIRENNNVINITWKGNDPYLNNSIVLRLTEYDSHYLIREIQLNIPKGNEVVTQKKAVAIVPTSKEKETDLSRKVVMRDGTFIHFSNVEFLRKNGNSGEITEASTTRSLYNVEIASICSACAVLVAVALYLVAVKAKARWLNKAKETKEEQETQC